MKTAEYIASLRAKDAEGLRQELVALRREQFNLRMQAAMGQMSQPHLAARVRRRIAQVKTVLKDKQAKAS